MTKIRKIISLIFICLICLTITSCKKKNKENNSSDVIQEETKLSKEELANVINAKMYNVTYEIKEIQTEGSTFTSTAKCDVSINNGQIAKARFEANYDGETYFYDYREGSLFSVEETEDGWFGYEESFEVDELLDWQENADILLDEDVINEVYDEIVFDKDKHSYTFSIVQNKHEINYEIVITNKKLVSVTATTSGVKLVITFSNIGTTVVRIPEWSIDRPE